MPRKAPEMDKNNQIPIKAWSLPPTVSYGLTVTSQLPRDKEVSQALGSQLKDQGRLLACGLAGYKGTPSCLNLGAGSWGADQMPKKPQYRIKSLWAGSCVIPLPLGKKQ